METPDERLELEHQLRNLQIGLKAAFIPLSLSVLLATWYSLGRTALTKSIVADAGNHEVALIAKLAFWFVDAQIPVLILSLAFFLSVVLSGMRYRGYAFLWVFAAQLSFGLFVITVLLSSSRIVEGRVIQNIMQ